ncbi:MAG: HD domain-containing protein, partial [Alphaproteobacteria bacterium]|nr:HD domain-containing protein [Alphaproteobacteria bacterium]
MAHDLHRAQVRKGDQVPYISHLLAVARIVLEAGADEDKAIACLLHDTVEDQRGLATASRIVDELLPVVAEIK